MSSSPPTDATCPICGDDPRYAVVGYCAHLEVTVGGITAQQPREQSKAEALAEYDSRMAAAVAGVAPVNRRIKQGHDGPDTSPEVPVVRKRRKRRSKEEMAEVRADEADRIRRIRRRVTPDWLQGQDEDEAAFVASLNTTENEQC